MASHISEGILKIIDNGKMSEIQRITIGDVEECQDGSEGVVYSDMLDVDTVWVLFAGAIGVAILVIIVYIVYLGTSCDRIKRRVTYPCYMFTNYQEMKN